MSNFQKVASAALGSSFFRVFGERREAQGLPGPKLETRQATDGNFTKIFGSKLPSQPPPLSALPSAFGIQGIHLDTPKVAVQTAKPIQFSALPNAFRSPYFPAVLKPAASTPTPTGNDLDFRTSVLPLYITLGIPIPRHREAYTARDCSRLKKKRKLRRARREVRPKSFKRWLGSTWPELQREIQAPCCRTLKCNLWIHPFAAVKARTDSVQLKRADLAAWVAGQLCCFDIVRNNYEYRFKGAKVCRSMWMRLHGIGDKTLRRAMRAADQDNKYFEDYGKSESPTEDLTWALLHQKFFVEQENEAVADGYFHMQDMMNFASVYKWVMSEWEPASKRLLLNGKVDPSGPSESVVRKVWRAEFERVKPIRQGDYAKCWICTGLASDHHVGFDTPETARTWRRDVRIHNKVHRACRRGSMRRAVEGAKDIQRVTAMTIDMTRPFHLPWCSRGSSDFRGKFVVRVHAGGATMFAHNMNFILCHLPNLGHKVNVNCSLLYFLLRWELFHPDTKAASILFLDWDGGLENVSITTQMLMCQFVKKKWRKDIYTHRMVTKHSHNAQDQKFFVMRHLGYNTTLMTTNFAQAFFKLTLGFKKKGLILSVAFG